jgi:hypothetical protein
MVGEHKFYGKEVISGFPYKNVPGTQKETCRQIPKRITFGEFSPILLKDSFMFRLLFLFLVWAALALPLWAQPVTKLLNPYLQNKNTTGEKLYFLPATGAVESQTGRKILKPGLRMLLSDYEVPEVELPDTFFDLMDTAVTRTDTGMHFDYRFYTFNSKGELLYHSFPYDNGPDYWSEGRRRFIEGEKMGLVNRFGQRLVPAARYSFLLPMRQGITVGCLDCVFTVFDATDEEHGYGWSGTRYEVVGPGGQILYRMKTTNPDSIVATLTLRRQYKNRAVVKRLQAQLQKLPETAKAIQHLDMPLDQFQYVCYDEPGTLSPYYHFGLEDTAGNNLGPGLQFLVSPDGKQILHLTPDLDEITPYAIWRKRKED